MSVELRSATSEDVPTLAEIFFASYNDLHRRFGQEAEDPGERAWLEEGLAHLLDTDPQGTLLALRDGEPCGMASSYRREGYWFLSFLFVLPEAQGRGIGRRLLEALLPSEDLTRALVVESFQPASTGLYAGYGITPKSVRYGLTVPTDLDRLPELPDDVHAASLLPEDLPGIGELDAKHLGYRRPQDHAWWLDRGTGWVYRRGEQIVGYGYLDADGGPGPALGDGEATLCAITADLLRRLDDPSSTWISVRGDTTELFGAMVRAGSRIKPTGYLYLYCSSGNPLPAPYMDFAAYLP